MGLFAAITGLFKRSSKEDQVNESQNVSISGGTSSVDTSTTASTTTTPVFTSSTSNLIGTYTTASTSGDIIIEEECACGGSCTCKEDPEQEVVDSSTYDFHSGAPPTIQATFSGMDDLPSDTKPEIEPPVKVHKIEYASTLSPISSRKLKQPQLPGFENDSITPLQAKKKSNTKKASTKLARKSTAKRKK